MRLNGVWIGWGLGDNSSGDFTVQSAKHFMRTMYRKYAGHLADTNAFDQEMYDAVVEMQRRLELAGRLVKGQYIIGALDLPTQQAMGFKKVKRVLPVIFTVEGHMSNMWAGPCASGAQTLQAQGVCYWQPVGYDCLDLPFNNRSGVDALFALLSGHTLPDGTAFPPGTPWGIWGFSQGGMVISEFMQEHVLPEGGALHWRLKDFKRGLGIGNPRRERGKLCRWARKQLSKDSGGIMDRLFVTTGTALEGRWEENAHEGDMFADNGISEADKDQTAIAKIICENSWVGGEFAVFSRVLRIFGNIPAGAFSAIKATIEAIMFLAKNPNPHYATVAEPGDIEWMRGVAA